MSSRVSAFAEGGAGSHEGRGVERVELNVRISLLHEGCGAGKKGPPGGHIIVSEKIVTGKGEVTPKQIVREWRKAWRSTLVSRGTHQLSRGHAGRG
jgi:hypothetical protein